MRRTVLTCLIVLPFALGACSGARDQLGLDKKAPDEFSVMKRAPLAMPPSQGLPKPRPGAPRPQEQSTDTQARKVVFGDMQSSSSTSQRSGESAFLIKAGANQSDIDIRTKVDAETQILKEKNKTVADKLLGLGGFDADPEAYVVDAPKEAARIRKNIKEGKPVTQGETPVLGE